MTTDAHPLFLNENDEAPPEIGYIHIVRYEGSFSSARKITIPKQFAAEELTELEQVFDLYGGGHYELIGRDIANQRITARRRHTLPGSPKPIVIDTEGEEVEEEETVKSTGMVPPPPGLDMTGILGMLMHSSTMQMQMMQQMAEQRSKDQSEQTKMQIAQMQESNRMMMQMMMMQQQKPQDTTMAPVLDLLSKMVMSGNKGSSFSDLLSAIKFGNDLKGNKQEAEDGTDWEQTLGMFLKAFNQANGGQGLPPGMALPPGMSFPPGFVPLGTVPPQQQPPMRRRVVDIHEGRVVPPVPVEQVPMQPAGPPDDKKTG